MVRSVLLLAMLPAVLGSAAIEPRPIRPNVVLIVVDDLGYGDLGCYGASPSRTPFLDRLAAQGVRSTDFYATQPVCSATRASILTGCYPNRIGFSGALDHTAKIGLGAGEKTIADVCHSLGYKTAAFGKWHLGHQTPFLPTHHGFDEFFGIPYSNDMVPEHPETKSYFPPLPLIEGDRTIEVNPDQDHFTSEFTTRSIDFIEKSHASQQPFFLYLAHPMPHVPLHASKAFRGKTGGGLYADVLAEIDDSVRRIVMALRDLDIEKDTLLLFVSDNGPWLSYGNWSGSAGPLREGKGTTFEGGVREPCIAYWPSHLPEGRVVASPWMAIDLLPTIASAIHATPADLPTLLIDGTSAWNLLLGSTEAPPHEALFFYYNVNDLEGVRLGRWKLYFPHTYRSMAGQKPGKDGAPGKYDPAVKTPLALYDLGNDLAETKNVAAEHAEIVKKIEKAADEMRADLGDALRGKKGSGVREPAHLLDVK